MNTTHVKSSPALWLTFVLLLCNLVVLAKPLEKVKKKEINQTFSVSGNDQLKVENKFGNITITHWNKKEVTIRIEIESRADSEEKAQRVLDRIQISIAKNGNQLSAVTTLKEDRGNSGNQSMTINYYIQMPAKLYADLSQKYGNINLPDKGNYDMAINVKYGNLKAGDFDGDLNMEAKYGNIEVGNLQNAQLDLGYVGNTKIGNAKKLTIDSKYSNLDMQDIQSLHMEIKYGNFSIESANRLDMGLKYSDAKIGTLREVLNLSDLSYSNLKVRALSASFSKVNVESHYGNLEIALPAKASFRVVAENMKYSNCNINGFNITHKQTGGDKDKDCTYEINGGKQPTIYYDGGSYGNLKVKAN